MIELDMLLAKRWILKSEDKEFYYRVRDAIGDIRRFAVDKMGCQLIENSLMVKLEKVPAKPENYMGIDAFDSVEEYVFLCILLMFLEDKEAQEQFILSQLTEYIAANMPDGEADWTLFVNRRKLVRVLRYAVKSGMVRITDGSDEFFMDKDGGEVLYENTGASKYFMRNFAKDIMGYTKPEDFEESDWFDMNEERGIARRHRVYKKLLFSSAMYKEREDDEDFEYLKYYGRRLADDLEQNFDCQVHIHKTSAYLIAGNDCHIGRVFPAANMISDILLLVSGEIVRQVREGLLIPGTDEIIRMDEIGFVRLLKEIKTKFGAGFTKEYREMPAGEFARLIQAEMERLVWIRTDKAGREVQILPIAGKITGSYPADFDGEQKSKEQEDEEQQMAGE